MTLLVPLSRAVALCVTEELGPSPGLLWPCVLPRPWWLLRVCVCVPVLSGAGLCPAAYCAPLGADQALSQLGFLKHPGMLACEPRLRGCGAQTQAQAQARHRPAHVSWLCPGPILRGC